MTCQIPESIIQKIMLYNSHPIADILKADREFRRLKKKSNKYDNSLKYIQCIYCECSLDYIRSQEMCWQCKRLAVAEEHEQQRYDFEDYSY